MNKAILILLVIYLVSCSTTKNYDEFYQREPNKETELLNEYLTPFFQSTQPPTSNVYLNDTLKPVSKEFSTQLYGYSLNYPDSSFRDALLDLSGLLKEAKPICFSQLNKIEHIKIIPKIKDEEINSEDLTCIYNFSLPGFNKDSTKMCYTYSYFCYRGVSIFSIIFMEKSYGVWKFVKKQVITQSII